MNIITGQLTRLLKKLKQAKASQNLPGEPKGSESFRRQETETTISWIFVPAGQSAPSRSTGKRRSNYYAQLNVGDQITLVRDAPGVEDPNAILLYSDKAELAFVDLGFVPKGISADLARFLDAGCEITPRVHRVTSKVFQDGAPMLLLSAAVEKIPFAGQIANFVCPECQEVLSRAVGWLAAHTALTCPHCGGIIEIQFQSDGERKRASSE
jgi:hypothetical protein